MEVLKELEKKLNNIKTEAISKGISIITATQNKEEQNGIGLLRKNKITETKKGE